jgi:hypothetical protein
MDFDGSVLSTKGHAEGSAIGFNKRKKGARSYYPLFCTVAQTGQFFDMHHRPGNYPEGWSLYPAWRKTHFDDEFKPGCEKGFTTFP